MQNCKILLGFSTQNSYLFTPLYQILNGCAFLFYPKCGIVPSQQTAKKIGFLLVATIAGCYNFLVLDVLFFCAVAASTSHSFSKAWTIVGSLNH
jgi:hypothetical protein